MVALAFLQSSIGKTDAVVQRVVGTHVFPDKREEEEKTPSYFFLNPHLTTFVKKSPPTP